MTNTKKLKRYRGFTLLEIAIVLAVIGYLSSQFVGPIGESIEQKRRQATLKQINSVLESVIGFASAHQRLPCPASADSYGVELDRCPGSSAHGFVPAATLGLSGSVNDRGLLLDSWGSPLRYSVSSSDHVERGSPGKPDFSTTGEMRNVGLQYLESDLLVCRSASRSANYRCPGKTTVANQLPVVVLSTGKDATINQDQHENQDDDSVFVSRPYSGNEENAFDDIVVWVSENRLFYYLIQAGVLP